MEQSGKMFKQTLDELALKLMKDLESGHSESYLEYLKFASQFHSYSFGNLMLIRHQLPNASQVASFNKWKSLGRQVQKGQKSLKILAPLLVSGKDSQVDGEKFCIGFKAVSVFDISQTEGEAIPVVPLHLDADDALKRYEKMKLLIQATGRTVTEVNRERNWFGSLSLAEGIKINENHSELDKALSLIHELAHDVLGHTKENKGLSRNEQECQAEATAFIVAESLGMKATVSKDYLLSYGTDAKMFMRNLEMIIKASRSILGIFSHIELDSTANDELTTAVA